MPNKHTQLRCDATSEEQVFRYLSHSIQMIISGFLLSLFLSPAGKKHPSRPERCCFCPGVDPGFSHGEKGLAKAREWQTGDEGEELMGGQGVSGGSNVFCVCGYSQIAFLSCRAGRKL